MLCKLHSPPKASAILPFVHLFYGSASQYLRRDDEGVEHEITQGEGGEQGDPLMPALFSLGQHNALQQAVTELHQKDHLLGFLDDIYVIITRARAADAFRGRRCHREHGRSPSALGEARSLVPRRWASSAGLA